ncbi:MAG: hypothetical protein WCO03_00195 [bacterium]
MLSSKTTINVAIIVLILMIIYFAYALFTGGSNTDKLSTGAVQTEPVDDTIVDPNAGNAGASTGNTQTAGTNQPIVATVSGSDAAAEFVRVLNSLQNVTLSGDIFNNEIFRNRLQDFSRPLPLRFSGRINPFAPFGPADLIGISNANALINSASTSARVASTSNLKVSPPVKSTPKATPKPPAPAPVTDENAGDEVDLGNQ